MISISGSYNRVLKPLKYILYVEKLMLNTINCMLNFDIKNVNNYTIFLAKELRE